MTTKDDLVSSSSSDEVVEGTPPAQNVYETISSSSDFVPFSLPSSSIEQPLVAPDDPLSPTFTQNNQNDLMKYLVENDEPETPYVPSPFNEEEKKGSK